MFGLKRALIGGRITAMELEITAVELEITAVELEMKKKKGPKPWRR